MGFNLTPAQDFRAVISFQSNGQPVEIMARFKTFPSASNVDEIINEVRGIDELMQGDPKAGMNERLQEIAFEIFLGWVNPEGREDLWVTDDNGPIEATEENILRFLDLPGVAFGLTMSFVEAHMTKSASVGNSEPSRGNGFRGRAKAGSSSRSS